MTAFTISAKSTVGVSFKSCLTFSMFWAVLALQVIKRCIPDIEEINALHVMMQFGSLNGTPALRRWMHKRLRENVMSWNWWWCDLSRSIAFITSFRFGRHDSTVEHTNKWQTAGKCYSISIEPRFKWVTCDYLLSGQYGDRVC
jgi:hypothetical protein